MNNMPNLTIIIPCFNEEAVLNETIEKLYGIINNLISDKKISPKSSLLFVNDGSRDKTKEILISASHKDKKIKSIHFIRNFGNQSAILAGLKTAVMELDSDCILTIDADLQQDETKIADFIEKYSEGYNVVLGIRKNRNGDNPLKKMFSSLFYKTMDFLDVHMPKNHSEYRLLSKKAVLSLLKYQENQIFLRGIIYELGYEPAYVEYDTKPRTKGESKFSYKTLFRLGFMGIISHSDKPLRIIFAAGLFVTLVCFLVLAVAVILELSTPGGIPNIRFFLGVFELIYQVRREFNKFDHSVLKIANGELDAELVVPKFAMLEELAISVKKMTQRLKTQIARLKELEEYKNDFLQNISHEIKTPITAINMALELSENSTNVEQNKECFRIIQFQIKAINKLVNDILILSEIDVEKSNKNNIFKMFNLNSSIEKAINSFEKGEIEINFSANSSIDYRGDENLIQSAIENLITNAIRYSSTDKIDINLLKEEKNIKISVKDYGIGIKPEFQGKIFEKFYRIDKARSRKKGGTGLGLAIVKNIVELHKGNIILISDENKGAEFIIELPLQ